MVNPSSIKLSVKIDGESQEDCSDSKLKPFHFQIKTYYLSDVNHQTDNSSHTNNPSSGNDHICYNECRAPALSWAFACPLLLFHKDYF